MKPRWFCSTSRRMRLRRLPAGGGINMPAKVVEPTPISAAVRPAEVAAGSWNPEDSAFWEKTGKRIAYRNLWVSVPCLLCAFSVWGYWSIITVQMKNLGFPFTAVQLFTLTAVAGLSGATLRIPNSFLIAIGGGRHGV